MHSPERIRELKSYLGHGGLVAVAKETGYDLSHVSRVLRGERRNEKIEAAIKRRIESSLRKRGAA